MLKALYDYAVTHQLALPAGFVKKTIKAYICLAASGEFLGIELTDGVSILCPDIGSLANGTDKANVLAEKRSVVLPVRDNAKSAFFCNTLESGAAAEPMLAVCLQALKDESMRNEIVQEADRLKIKDADRVSFRVNGCSILGSQAAMEWWAEFRRQFINSGPAEQVPCLITGRLTVASATVPPISGLFVVGGHARGDALICFDKPAFCSYGLKQGANAPVSEEAFSAIKAALDKLLEDAPILAGMKFVHWYDKPVPAEDDGLSGIFAGFAPEDAEDTEDALPIQDAEVAAAARRQGNELVRSVYSGTEVPKLANEYFIILLTGVGGRVMIRRYERGSYEELQKNIKHWRQDLALLNDFGTGNAKPRKLNGMLIKLLPRQNEDKDVFKRLAKELSGITPAVITSILTNSRLPDAVAARALAYIRSMMLNADEDRRTPQIPDATACQWLKAWLLRRERTEGQEETLMAEYNPNHTSAAYHCGALVALYAAIQREAMPDVNAGVIQRYYASASQTPALVIGQLSRLSNYHLGKMDNPYAARRYEKLLNAVYSAIGYDLPVTLDLEQQSYFALGYRQFSIKLDNDVRNAKAAKAQRKADMAAEDQSEEKEDA